MRCLRAAAALLVFCGSVWAADAVRAADLAQQLRQLSLDSKEAYRVRDLRLRRGDVNIYLNEGILSFAVPVNGRRIAAIFTTVGAEAGDAEILVMPPQPAERASLAFFTKSANMDEHFTSAVLFFSDDTANEIMKKLDEAPIRKASEVATQLEPIVNPVLRSASTHVSTRAVASLLDAHDTKNGFFYAAIAGDTLGTFDLLYQPDNFEPVTIGKVSGGPDLAVRFDSWVSYRPRHDPPYVPPSILITDYRINAVIQPDLGIAAESDFRFQAPRDSGRVIALKLSGRMTVDAASINGQAAEVLEASGPDVKTSNSDGEFLVISSDALAPGTDYRIQIRYHGSVIHQADDSYAVTERSLWYPHTEPMLTSFDLTFRCPEQFEIVSTGELVSEEVVNGIRIVHRKTPDKQQLAGFNLGEYQSKDSKSSPYLVTVYADKSAPADLNGIPDTASLILDFYTRQWLKLPLQSVAITPVPANFGQGFPGLIYLAKLAYVPEAARPVNLRGPRENTFFSRLLLPHELAHEWWGNMVTAADYRTEWLMEAMAHYAALEFLQHEAGPDKTGRPILEEFRDDLDRMVDGRRLEASGPVDFGLRLLSTSGFMAWHTVEYEKGAWVLHMLHERLGDEGFRTMQLALLRDYSGKPITNEEFRELASRYVPQGQPDRELKVFFDTWVYGTGIPRIHIAQPGGDVEVTGVGDDFTADLPLRCKSKDGTKQTRWIRINSGSNSLPSSREASVCELPPATDYLYFPQ